MFKFTERDVRRLIRFGLIMAVVICFYIFFHEVKHDYSIKNQNMQSGNEISINVKDTYDWHKYKVYQVFKGKVFTDDMKISNVEYGVNYSGRKGVSLEYELKQIKAGEKEETAFKETVWNMLKGEPVAILTKENPSIELEPGYYIIIDESLYELSNPVTFVYVLFMCFASIGVCVLVSEILLKIVDRLLNIKRSE